MYSIPFYNAFEVLDPSHFEREIFEGGINPVVSQIAEHLLNVIHMLLPCLAEDEDIVYVDNHP